MKWKQNSLKVGLIISKTSFIQFVQQRCLKIYFTTFECFASEFDKTNA